MSPRKPFASVRKPLAITIRCCWLAFFALIAVDLSGQLPFPMPWIWLPAGLAVAGTLVLGRLLRAAQTARRPTAVEVDPPVTGRWSALNSPADRVPSHGTHQLGQTYAIDIVAEGDTDGDADGGRPGFRWLWPLARRSSAFPAFGAPVLAVADATVVRVSDGRRDHLSRTSLLALIYMLLVEGAIRSVAGTSRIVGNHVVLHLGDGVMPSTRISSAAPRWCGRATGSLRASCWPAAGTPATPRSRISTSS